MQKSLIIAKVLRKLTILRRGWLRSFNFYLKIKINNTVFKIPIIKNISWNNLFEKEPWMTELLEKLLPVIEGCFIDVGVNVGQTLFKVKSADKTRDYIGFEVKPS